MRCETLGHERATRVHYSRYDHLLIRRPTFFSLYHEFLSVKGNVDRLEYQKLRWKWNSLRISEIVQLTPSQSQGSQNSSQNSLCSCRPLSPHGAKPRAEGDENANDPKTFWWRRSPGVLLLWPGLMGPCMPMTSHLTRWRTGRAAVAGGVRCDVTLINTQCGWRDDVS